MFDAIYDSEYPPAGPGVCFAGYVDGSLGNQPDYGWLVKNRPGSPLLSIALDPAHDAMCLDIENGAATPGSAAAWYERQRARGISRPCFYASASVMQANVVPVIEASGIARASVRLWAAHYDGEHICGPSSCRLLSVAADGTQWTDRAMGRDLDQSLLLAGFFGTPPPAPDPTEVIVQQLPVLKLGASGVMVRRVQGLLVAAGYDLGTTGPRRDGIDGSFGAATLAGVKSVQAAGKIAQDGVVGPATWGVLLTGAA